MPNLSALVVLLILISINASSSTSFKDQMVKDWSSPIYDETSQNVFLYGGSLTAALVIFRDETVEKFQDSARKHGIMSKDMADTGDLMGQCLPNLLYMAGTYIDGSKDSLRKSKVMLKTTAYAGITTMILKRIVNQRRPDSDNRHSFPSGHTTTAFAFASVVAKEHEWYWGAGAYSLATLVGLSRIHDNAHYLHDVVFGATIGTSFGIALSNLSKKEDTANYSFIPFEDGGLASISWTF